MPNSPLDVFERLVGNDDQGPDVARLISYGLFARDLSRWHKHRISIASVGDSAPTHEEINDHVRKDLSEEYFLELENKGLELFGRASLDFLEDYIEQQKVDAVSESILGEVRKAGGFGRQLLFALIAAILTPIILGGVVAGVLIWDRYSPVPGSLARRIAPPENSTTTLPPNSTKPSD